ncbi:ERCC4 domain-containing protein [Collinsella intestinalis]|uniref:ERCC4 domain-containing protein n=1 Tax=Collinsella intestinalis TaxID=147207 RepID=UPI0025A4A189|nr:ERCC4 domain-containing protein [Collinsella intestinalis]MDM8162441.1 ERCC4 domain-containing protein [Collinsella intestinalis]
MGRTIIEDTRNKIGQHAIKNDWWAAHGVKVVRRKLDYGDYMRDEPGWNVAVDTKKDVQELAGNVGREHDRFVRELDRARDAGCRLFILVEELEAYNDRELLHRWVCRTCRMCPEFRAKRCDPNADACRARRFKPMNGATLAKIVTKLEQDHGALFLFTRRGDSARTICDLLGVEYDE